jgi:hypothetical protein
MPFYKKNILPDLSDTIINGNIEFYESSEELLKIFESVSLDVVSFFIELDNAKSSDNVLKNLTDKYAELNNKDLKINKVEIPNNFKLYLNEKFQNLLYLFKHAIRKKVKNMDEGIFSSYSDDIGMTLEINHNIGLTNSPIFDSFYNLQSSGPPTTIPSTMFNKVSKNLLKNFKKMSLKNDAILKTSLKSIAGYGTQNISQQPHGNNLVYDNFYEKSKKELTNSKTEKIIEIFGENLGDLITFYKNLNIRQQEGNKSYFINFQNNIEGVENVLDMFNNNIYTTATVNIPSDANFVPHNMYDPKTGAVFFASTEALHLQYTQLGYTHTKPNILPSSTSSTTQTSSPLPNTGSQVSTGPSSTGSGGGTYSGGSTGSSGGGY